MRELMLGINEICRLVGMGRTTLYRYLNPDGSRRTQAPPLAGV
ncbi:MAG: helix-turn-helix domain-containing protein [Caldilineaceae bacterium]|nr:helix-turn-helix domain-containing protein [Caldilineaceae bacterium]